MGLNPVAIPRTHEAKGADSGRGEQLHRQNGVDLPDELVANVDSGFSDGAAKLGKWF